MDSGSPLSSRGEDGELGRGATPVHVFCRIRPHLPAGTAQSTAPVVLPDERGSRVLVREHRAGHTMIRASVFPFDGVLGPHGSQEQAYRLVAQPVVRAALRGFNGTVLAYGQSGAGKTHTILGSGRDSGGAKGAPLDGMLAMAVDEIFAGRKDGLVVLVSVVEIYMERVLDLLAVPEGADDDAAASLASGSGAGNGATPPPAPKTRPSASSSSAAGGGGAGARQPQSQRRALAVREAPTGSVFVEGETRLRVRSRDEALRLVSRALASRVVAETRMNEQSSRSHALVSFILERPLGSSSERFRSKLMFVDLAGSELVRRTGASGINLEEAKIINKSLSCLGNVINALATRSSKGSTRGGGVASVDGESMDDGGSDLTGGEERRGGAATAATSAAASSSTHHIPYRDSKLTRLLQESLGGNSRTVLVICCSPDSVDLRETISTLRFGGRAMHIENFAKIATLGTPPTSPLAELRKKLADAQKTIAAQRVALESSRKPSPTSATASGMTSVSFTSPPAALASGGTLAEAAMLESVAWGDDVPRALRFLSSRSSSSIPWPPRSMRAVANAMHLLARDVLRASASPHSARTGSPSTSQPLLPPRAAPSLSATTPSPRAAPTPAPAAREIRGILLDEGDAADDEDVTAILLASSPWHPPPTSTPTSAVPRA